MKRVDAVSVRRTMTHACIDIYVDRGVDSVCMSQALARKQSLNEKGVLFNVESGC